jgi:biotin operon repressor
VTAWTKREVNYLIRHYGTKSTAEIAAKLGRSTIQIWSKANDLRKAGHNIKRVKTIRRWSEAEHSYLIKHYATQTTAKIAEHLGRTPMEITSMAGALRKSKVPIPEKPLQLGRGQRAGGLRRR